MLTIGEPCQRQEASKGGMIWERTEKTKRGSSWNAGPSSTMTFKWNCVLPRTGARNLLCVYRLPNTPLGVKQGLCGGIAMLHMS